MSTAELEPWQKSAIVAVPSVRDVARSFFGRGPMGSVDEFLECLAERDRLIARLIEEARPPRPSRRMPSTKTIANHHNLPDRTCWRCGEEGYVERAHIVDRIEWPNGAGLDGPQNLALLCGWCHRQMPIIKPEDWEKGLDYVGLGGTAESESGMSPIGALVASYLRQSGDS